MRRTELILAALLALCGLGTIVFVIPHYVATDATESALTPAFMPYVAAAVLTIAALAWLVELTRRPAPRAQVAGDARFVASAAGVFASSYVLMTVFGFVVGGIVLVTGVLTLARVRSRALLVAPIVTPVVLWLLFSVLLATPLP